jgi:Rieske Fe-S protein
MPGEDQERFEDYLELEHYIEELQAGRVAHPPSNLTPTQARIYRTAALFRSASPDAATPRPEFVEALHARLLAMDQEDAEADTLKMPALNKIKEPAATSTPAEEPASPSTPVEEPSAASAEQVHPIEPEVPAPPTQPRKGIPKRASFFSRRSLLTGGAVAAASLVVGGSIGAMAEHSATTPPVANTNPTHTSTPAHTNTPTPTPGYGTPLVPDGTWHFVDTLDHIGENALRFATDAVVGYVILADEDEGGVKKGDVIAISASCTHMGCLVQWQSEDRQFHCPCHGGIFTEYGETSPNGKMKYLKPLPRMTTKIQGDRVYVLVPKSNT